MITTQDILLDKSMEWFGIGGLLISAVIIAICGFYKINTLLNNQQIEIKTTGEKLCGLEIEIQKRFTEIITILHRTETNHKVLEKDIEFIKEKQTRGDDDIKELRQKINALEKTRK